MVPADVWEAIASRGQVQRFNGGEVLMHHGSSGRSCFAIRSGEVIVTVTSTQGSTLVLARHGHGQLVGEWAALADAPRSATVTAKTEVEAVRLTWEEFNALLCEYPDWSVGLLQHLAVRMRSLSERFALRSEDLHRRVLDVLHTHLEETGDPVFRSTREELAGWIGATREATTRTLQKMKAERIIDLRRGEVEVLEAGSRSGP